MSVKKGDPVRVRLESGEVVDGFYDQPTVHMEKSHWVTISTGQQRVACGGPHPMSSLSPIGCRFVGPTPTPVKAGEQK